MSRIHVVSIIVLIFCVVCAADVNLVSASTEPTSTTNTGSIQAFSDLYKKALSNSYAYQTTLSILKDAGTDVALSNWEWAPKADATYNRYWSIYTNSTQSGLGVVNYRDVLDRHFTSQFQIEETVFDGFGRINRNKVAEASRIVADRSTQVSRQEVLLALIQLIINLNSSTDKMNYAYWSLANSLSDPLPDQYWSKNIENKSFDDVENLYQQAAGLLETLNGKNVSATDSVFNQVKRVADDSQSLILAYKQAEADLFLLLRFIGSPQSEGQNIRLNPRSDTAFAEPSDEYSFQTAQENNYSLMKAKSELVVANAQRNMQISGYLPTVSANLLYGYYEVPIPLTDTLDKLDLATVGVELSWEIDTLFTTPLQYDKATRKVELAVLNIKQIEDNTKTEIEVLRGSYKYSFYLWQLSSVTVQLKRAYLENRLENFQKAQDKAGALSDLEEARSEYSKAELDRIQVRSNLLSSWAQLLNATGKLTVENFYSVLSK